MDSYEALAASYDELTEDVEYEKRADFVEKLFLRAKRPVRSVSYTHLTLPTNSRV